MAPAPVLPPDPGDPRITTGQGWSEVLAALAAMRDVVLAGVADDDALEHAAATRYLTRFLAAGIRVCMEADDPDHPVFARMAENDMSWGLDNPDCNYSWAPLRGDATYRVHGRLGSANHVEFQVTAGHFGDGGVGRWKLLSSVAGDGLEVGADGAFELWISPEARAGNWIRNHPEASFLLLRQYLLDWEREEPAVLAIERVDAWYPPPPPRTDAVATHLDRLLQWLDTGARSWAGMHAAIQGMEPGAMQLVAPGPENAGLQGQVYGMGPWRCEPGEAVVVELDVPASKHWSVSLANRCWESVDFAGRQSSLNGAQAVVDGDGRFRGVVAHEDPGVWNWLDPAGHRLGTLAIRFLFPETTPGVRIETVAADDLAAVLPPGTRRVTPDERRDVLARRRAQVQRRYRY